MAVKGSSQIIVCGQRFAVDHAVVNFEDEGGYSAYVPHRTDDIGKIYASHPAPGLEHRVSRYRRRRSLGHSRKLHDLKKVVRQIVVHLDGCRDAAMCFNVLHNQRGLSVHFMVDNDGTIYQTLDLVDCAFHAAGVNEIAVGIELQNRGDAARYPNYYGGDRSTVTCTVHGHQFLAYDFTEQQYRGMTQLCRTLTRVFDIPLTSPHDGSGLRWTTIDNARRYRGFIGHYHLTTNKWDPGPWDFQRLFRTVGSRVTFPLTRPRRDGKRESKAKRAQLQSRYYENSEEEASAHFPVGPLGRSRLWHGGVHLTAPPSAPVYAAIRGQVVAARRAPPCAIGSCSFVLLRHELTVGKLPWTFYSLYYHLAGDDGLSGRPPRWATQALGTAQGSALGSGQVALLGINVEAGEQLGVVGEAGPSGHRESQIHFAVFAREELGRRIDPGFWEVVDGGSSRLCDHRALLERIDRPVGGKPPDGKLSRRELRNFFSFNDRREELRRLVVRYRSEWTPGGWQDELMRAGDFAALPPGRRRRLYDQQIRPTLWWTSSVAAHAALPSDGVVYAYHPIGFVAWFDKLARRSSKLRADGIEGADRWRGKLAPKHLTVDAESAQEMTDVEDFYSGESSRKLTLEDIVEGYPDEDQGR